MTEQFTTFMNTRKTIVGLSLAAGCCILTMFGIALVTGVSQEQFEITQNLDVFKQQLAAAETALRLTLGVDIIFICLFATLWIFLTQYLKNGDRVNDAIANVSLGAMLLCALLDFHEDIHFLTLIRNVKLDLPVSHDDVSLQMILSAIKFCASYFAVFLLGFLLPKRTVAEKLLVFSFWFVQLPVGALVYAGPSEFYPLFTLFRFVFMVSGFFLLAYTFSQNAPNDGN